MSWCEALNIKHVSVYNNLDHALFLQRLTICILNTYWT